MYKDEFAVRIRDLSKMYKTYHTKNDKVLDLLNIRNPFKKNNYEEFWALRDINIEIRKGQKIGIIGRNGAGKSTLLKIITGNVKPNTGSMEVNGKVSALLELGTGFHPEFTGRENIFASLAYLGVTRKEAEKQLEEIIEFSELEDFIDKPVKTYSAGMYTRLAFSVSTAISPEILIIDEVLGAGDAYFLNKSIERMKKLTEGGTTVLFVSHDIISVQKMCNEAIWIDNGKIMMKGDTLSVSKEYLYAIRQQEELRLRAKNLKIKQRQLKLLEEGDHVKSLVGHFIVEEGSPVAKHPIHSIVLSRNGIKVYELKIGDAMDNNSNRTVFLLVNKGTINWSNSIKIDEKYVRCFEDLGGIYEHAVFMINLPEEDFDFEHPQYTLTIEYKDTSKEKVYVEIYDGETYNRIGNFDNSADNQWKENTFLINESIYSNKTQDLISQRDEFKEQDNEKHYDKEKEQEQEATFSSKVEYKPEEIVSRSTNDIYGSGEIVITNVKFLGEELNSQLVFVSGEKMICRIHFYSKEVIPNLVFVVAIYKLDGTCVVQAISSKDHFYLEKINGKGYVDVIFDPLLLGRGDYIVSTALFKSLNLADSNEPQAYDLHDRRYQIKVEQPFGINVELGMICHPIKWGIRYE